MVQSGISTATKVQRNGNLCVLRDVLGCCGFLEGLFIRKLDQAGTRKSDQGIWPGGNFCKMYSVQDVETANNQRRHEGCPRSEPLFGETFYPTTRGCEPHLFQRPVRIFIVLVPYKIIELLLPVIHCVLNKTLQECRAGNGAVS